MSFCNVEVIGSSINPYFKKPIDCFKNEDKRFFILKNDDKHDKDITANILELSVIPQVFEDIPFLMISRLSIKTFCL